MNCPNCNKKRLRFINLLRWMRNAIKARPDQSLNLIDETIQKIQGKNSII